MAGFLIAIISGALMSVQGVFNTTATKSSSIWVAASFVQITAFATCVLMWLYDGRPPVSGTLYGSVMAEGGNKARLGGSWIGAENSV